MASTYTDSTGIEKPGSGEQAGSWGATTNRNFDIIDRGLHGVNTITLSATTKTITTTDGATSEGQYKAIIFDGTPGGNCTVTLSPANSSKVFLINNTTANNLIFTQGSGGNATVEAGKSAWVYADGAGSGAQVRKLDTDLSADSSPTLGGNLDTNNNNIAMGTGEIQFGTSKWGIKLDSGDNDILFQYNGTTVFKISSSGAVVASDNITAYGSP